jgi:Trk K+ transport system NAD-binding subunit
LEPRGIVIVVGSPASLDRLEGLLEGARNLTQEGMVIIAGFGEVGSKVHQLMSDVGEKLLVLDRHEREGVDLVGNILDPTLLEAANIREASSVVLALDSDDATVFATVIVRELAPEVPVIARVNQARNKEKIYLAGADFALSLGEVAGQFLASRLLGQEARDLGAEMKLLKVSGRGLVGRHPTEARIRERTGCSVVAVERGDDVVVELGGDFRFQADDSVFLSGSEEGIRRFREIFQRQEHV